MWGSGSPDGLAPSLAQGLVTSRSSSASQQPQWAWYWDLSGEEGFYYGLREGKWQTGRG